MSTPVTMPMPGNVDRNGEFRDVRGYVAAVRAELDDLTRDEIEELTGGLEADLADALQNQEAAPVVMFGAPADYAAELRSAAGLPPRRVRGGQGFGSPQTVALGLREVRDRAMAWLIAWEWWPDVRDFVLTLRSVWWLLRGYIAYQFADQLITDAKQALPYSAVTWSVLVLLMVGSLELGRRSHAQRGPRVLIAAGNALTLLLVLVAMIDSVSTPGTYFADRDRTFTTVITQPPDKGLFNAGYQVVNVFPYDKNGQPLKDVQLFDDRGRPIAPETAKYTGRNDEEVRLVPAVTSDGGMGLNVFPLREQVTNPGYDPQTGEQLPKQTNGSLRNAALPDPTQPAVVPIPVPIPVPVPAASSTPSATPEPIVTP